MSKNVEEKMDVDTEVAPSTSTSKSVVESRANSEKNVIAGSTVPSVSCAVHPLVIMNISDHWTRIRAQNGAKSQGIQVKFYIL